MLRSDKRIESIQLIKVGPFGDCAFTFPINRNPDLAEVHVFTGGNGSGKSTLLYCLALMFAHPMDGNTGPISRVLARMSYPESRFSFKRFGFDCAFVSNDPSQNRVDPDHVPRSLTFWPELRKFANRGNDFIIVEKSADGATLFAADANFKFHWQRESQSVHSARYKRDFLPLAYNGQRPFARNSGAPLAIQDITQSPLDNNLSFGKSIDPNLITQWIANALAKEAIALKDKDPAKATNLRQTLDRLTQAINDIAEGDFSFKLDTNTLDVKAMWRGDELAIDVLPDGMKSIIALISDILMRIDRLPWADSAANVLDQPLILFLDEIDIHLHPQWQRKVLPTVQKLFRNAQIFVSTHSPFVVGSVEDAWVYQLDKARADNTSGQALNIEPITSGAGTSYEVLLEEVFGITEHFDIETQRLYAALKAERNTLLRDPGAPDGEFKRLAQTLAQRSEELDGLVSLELRQLKKQGRTIDLTAPTAPAQEAANGQV